MPRFYCQENLSPNTAITLPDNIAHHVRVVRLAIGTSIILFNGQGGQYHATIHKIDKKSVVANITSFDNHDVELPYTVNLAQALPASSKMEWIIEKSVELGVNSITPLVSSRCVTQLKAERAEKKIQHWQNIVVAASEQSGRNRLAQIDPVIHFKTWLTQIKSHQHILLSPRASLSLSDWAHQHTPQNTTIIIGPEGGLSEEEEALAIEQGAQALTMGPRILRTETAGLATLASLIAIWAIGNPK